MMTCTGCGTSGAVPKTVGVIWHPEGNELLVFYHCFECDSWWRPYEPETLYHKPQMAGDSYPDQHHHTVWDTYILGKKNPGPEDRPRGWSYTSNDPEISALDAEFTRIYRREARLVKIANARAVLHEINVRLERRKRARERRMKNIRTI